jgi:hypothetical protein
MNRHTTRLLAGAAALATAGACTAVAIPAPNSPQSQPTATIDPGNPVLLAPRTKTTGCTLSPKPDRRCSPGAYASRLTEAVICAPSFKTGSVRTVPDSEKHDVETEYGMTPRAYGKTLEIDHIVSLELGGSNNIANLFPEQHDIAPGYKIKDKLENKLHNLVCTQHTMTLQHARTAIATNWALYKQVYGTNP